MSENRQAPFIKGKKKREALRLPQLHFIAADDWMHKLGYEGFGAWLQFHTWVDRKDANRAYDKIPMSLEASWEKLGISKSKFYRLIAPMWEYGLIDIIEYEESKRIGQKPKNIVVYEYPFHEEERMFKPLEKLRDWKKDYVSKSKEVGQLGGRPKKSSLKKKDDQQPEKKREISVTVHRFKNKTVKKPAIIHRFKIETVNGFKIKTVTVSKLKRNNVSNNSINDQITPNNVKNLSIIESIDKLDIPTRIKGALKDKIDRLILHKIDLSDIELLFKLHQKDLAHLEFESILLNVLDAKKYHYGFRKYMSGAIDKFIENRLKRQQEQPDGQASSGRKEMIPEFMDEDRKKKQYSDEEKKANWIRALKLKKKINGEDSLTEEEKAILAAEAI